MSRYLLPAALASISGCDSMVSPPKTQLDGSATTIRFGESTNDHTFGQ